MSYRPSHLVAPWVGAGGGNSRLKTENSKLPPNVATRFSDSNPLKCRAGLAVEEQGGLLGGGAVDEIVWVETVVFGHLRPGLLDQLLVPRLLLAEVDKEFPDLRVGNLG